MALFGKKTKSTSKEGAPARGASAEDFSPEALEALADSADNGANALSRRPVSFRNGTILGLDIGAANIKVVEVTAKGNSCTVTGVGIAPTPPDSISNGVVMSISALSDAVKELLSVSGMKNRKVVTSIAGTGEVIVRVIEVPSMTDAELKENITTDIDRYIPFAPSEVQWDVAAMRDLPSDPESTTMDALLVAARHELIDLHLELLEAVKLDPQAIDVTPLAAVRAISEPRAIETGGVVDYNDTYAIVDIGASMTDISISRGSEMVFTRSLPTAGNTMTQALVDQLGMTHSEAEQAKRQQADALPASEDDSVSDFDTDIDNSLTDADDSKSTSNQEEPGEQHQQKIPEDAGDNEGKDANEDDIDSLPQISDDEITPDSEGDILPSKSTESEKEESEVSSSPDQDDNITQENDIDDDVISDLTSLPSINAEDSPLSSDTEAQAEEIANDFFNFEDSSEEAKKIPTIQGKPQHTEAPPEEGEEQEIDLDDSSSLPAIAASSSGAPSLSSAFDFPSAEADTGSDKAGAADPVGDLDLSDILGDTPEVSPAEDIDEGLGAIDEETGDEDDLSEELGTGLSLGLETLEAESSPELSVNEILIPILEDLTGELRRSLEYHSARYPDAPVSRIILIGGGAKMRNLDAYFTSNLGIPTTVGDPLSQLNVKASGTASTLLEEQGSTLAVALGLALRGATK